MTGALKKWNIISDAPKKASVVATTPAAVTEQVIQKQEAQAEAEKKRAVTGAMAKRRSRGQGGFASLMTPDIDPEQARGRMVTQTKLGAGRNPRSA